jgi:hypothetical protein
LSNRKSPYESISQNQKQQQQALNQVPTSNNVGNSQKDNSAQVQQKNGGHRIKVNRQSFNDQATGQLHVGGNQSGREHVHSELQHYEMMNLRGNAAQLGNHNQTGSSGVISQNATPNLQRQIPTLEGHANVVRSGRPGRNASNQMMPSLISAHSAAKLQHNDYSDSHAN